MSPAITKMRNEGSRDPEVGKLHPSRMFEVMNIVNQN